MRAGTPASASRFPAATAPGPWALACRPSVRPPENAPVRPDASTAVSWRCSASGSVATSASIAACGAAPAASASRSRPRRRGSVRFCDATAPTPARTAMQRAATAGLEDVTTAPKRPPASTPSSEKVMPG